MPQTLCSDAFSKLNLLDPKLIVQLGAAGTIRHETGNGRVRWETYGCILGAAGRPKWKFQPKTLTRLGTPAVAVTKLI
jgi:hypothetical protein